MIQSVMDTVAKAPKENNCVNPKIGVDNQIIMQNCAGIIDAG